MSYLRDDFDLDKDGFPSRMRNSIFPMRKSYQIAPRVRMIRGIAVRREDGKYVVPEGHGMYSGRIVPMREFEYAESEEDNIHIYHTDEPYNFADDKDFAMKFKAFFSDSNFYRRQGRTHLLAKVIVETAIETGNRVYFPDDHVSLTHQHKRQYEEHLKSEVREVLGKMQAYVRHLDVVEFSRESIMIRCYDLEGYNKYRIADFNPKPASKYVVGFDPYREEVREDDELLLICCTL